MRPITELAGKPAIVCGFIVSVVSIIYANSLLVPFYFDDWVRIVGNPEVERFALAWSDPRLIGTLSLAVNYALHGVWTPGYHLVNIAIHAACALLVFALTLALMKTPGMRRVRNGPVSENGIAVVAALLFACHPINTQAVTYVVQRLTSLAALFYLASGLAWVIFRTGEENGRRQWRWYALSLLAALLSYKTKENTALLPLTLGLVEITCFRSRTARTWLLLAVFLGMVAIIPLSYWFATGDDTVELSRAYTNMTRTSYATTQIAVVGTYLRLLVFPVGQSLDYDYPIYDSLTNPAVLAPLMVHGLLLVAALFLVLGRERWSPPLGRLVGFGIGWFYLNLLVESSVIPIVDVINEHRVYLPAIGLFMSVSVVAVGGLARAVGRRPAVFMIVAVIGLLGFATVRRNEVWRSPVRFWSNVVKGSPRKPRALNNLGVAYSDAGDPESAIPWFRRAIEADPNYFKAYYNLGEAEFRAGRPQLALAPLQFFVLVWPNHPLGHELIGKVYRQLGNLESAAHHEQIGAELRRQSREEGLDLRFRGEKEPPPVP